MLYFVGTCAWVDIAVFLSPKLIVTSLKMKCLTKEKSNLYLFINLRKYFQSMPALPLSYG